MKKIHLKIILLFLFCGYAVTGFANVRLPAIIGNHMVLQQKSEVNFWGWCDPAEQITIQSDWDTTTYHTAGLSGGKWSLVIKTPAAGGPYKITIKGNNSLVLEDVMLGEVWDCSGQSNMEMSYGWGAKEYTADVENSANKNIRFFHIPRLTADYPQDDTRGSWVVCNPEDMKSFSLVGYFFGKQIQEKLQVPIGLINASWGGTSAEVWTPADSVENNPILKEAAGKLVPAAWWPEKPGYTYNAMIYPITRYTIAGVIWYQGEANVGTAATYTQVFQTMIRSWRTAWKKELPFYFVQIAPFAGYGTSINSSLLREAQTKSLSLPGTGMVVITDQVDNIKDIHPQKKKAVGLRLAAYALAETYGQSGVAYKSPFYKSMEIKKDKAVISFDNAEKGLKVQGDTLTGFYIAGSDKVFVPAKAKIEGGTVVVSNKNVKLPVAVRFGFTSSSMPNLFSSEGLPVNIFRTDEWDISTEAETK